MSYLSSLRLHFSGRFQANVPTRNNELSTLDPALRGDPEPGWNPGGDCTWRLLHCAIKTAVIDDKEVEDPVTSFLVADSDRRSPAKIADIDPLQQLSATIYGLELRICTPDGGNLLRGRCETTTWNDPFNLRTPSALKDSQMGAAFQTIVTELEWADDLRSPFLQRLRAACPTGRLSLKFNADGFTIDSAAPEFTTGRIAGTLGPAHPDEPNHFVLGRRLMCELYGAINHAVAVVDEQAKKIRVDVGNSLPTVSLGGDFIDQGSLTLRRRDAKDPKVRCVVGSVSYLKPKWYEKNAGIEVLPIDHLSVDERVALREHPLELWLKDKSGVETLVLAEPEDGLYARADATTFRMSPGETQFVTLHATRFGKPTATRIVPKDYTALLGSVGDIMGGYPRRALTVFEAVTDHTGKGVAALMASDPGQQRRFLDGQVYCYRYEIPGAQRVLRAMFDVINVRVWDRLTVRQPIWCRTIRPIFAYYQRLYPVKRRFLKLTDIRDIAAHRDMILLALQLPIEDPNHMPATRDLSPARRDAIVQWLLTLPPSSGRLRKKVRPALASAPPAPDLPEIKGAGKSDAFRAALDRILQLPPADR